MTSRTFRSGRGRTAVAIVAGAGLLFALAACSTEQEGASSTSAADDCANADAAQEQYTKAWSTTAEELGIGRVFDFIPMPAVVFAVLAVIVGVVLARTTLGRRVYATGSNPRAARLSGVPTGWIVAGAYVASALTAVLAGFVNAGYIGYVDAGLSRSLDLNSIAAAVIGGVALTGGKGRIGQTVVGVVLLAVLLTWLVQLGAGAGAQLIVSGVVILGAVWLQSGRFTLSTIRHLTQRG